MRKVILPALPMLLLGLTASAAPIVLPGTADNSVMRGFPPPSDKLVTRVNQVDTPNLPWTLTHTRMILPTIAIRRGPLAEAKLISGSPLSLPDFVDLDGTPISVQDWLVRTRTDSLLVLHDGKLVYEGYAQGIDPAEPHTIQSMTKSFTGLIAAMLIDAGQLDPRKKVAEYVPELAQSAWGTATVQQTLNMRVGMRYDENIKDANSDVRKYYGVAAGIFPPPSEYSGPRNIYEMLKLLPQNSEHGKEFAYKSVNPEAIAWVISRITGKSVPELISERIWQKVGMGADAYVTADPAGMAMMGGGMSATAQDLVRFGEMLRLNGRFNDEQIVPATVVETVFNPLEKGQLRVGRDRSPVPGYSYHNFWWLPPEPDVVEALGGFGQRIHVNRRARTVIVKFSSAPIGLAYDETKRLDLLAFREIDRLFTSP